MRWLLASLEESVPAPGAGTAAAEVDS